MLMNILKTIHAILALCLGALLFTGLAAALVAWLKLITR